MLFFFFSSKEFLYVSFVFEFKHILYNAEVSNRVNVKKCNNTGVNNSIVCHSLLFV